MKEFGRFIAFSLALGMFVYFMAINALFYNDDAFTQGWECTAQRLVSAKPPLEYVCSQWTEPEEKQNDR